MKKLYGNIKGLKPNQIRRLENIYHRRTPPDHLISSELSKDVGTLSFEIGRQIGLLIDRLGKIEYVIVGNKQGILIPDLSSYRIAVDRLRGLRCVHTHLNMEPLNKDDLTDLGFLKLDLMASILLDERGLPLKIHWAHILPNQSDGPSYQIMGFLTPNELDIGCKELISSIEEELSQKKILRKGEKDKERAYLISVSDQSRKKAHDSLQELKELAESSGIVVIDSLIQKKDRGESRFLIGKGKLKDLSILSLNLGISMLIFDQDLSPSQIRSIADEIELKVIDRTQLILDIFAQRAQSKEGKLQVELAQMKYLLPRLTTKNTAMSRLTGGIGGRGPGETKLEINRRHMRTRIEHLEKALTQVQKHRRQQRSFRNKKRIPVLSIVGYTNAGKSTLLNTLTKSDVFAANQLFATLDPSSRRLRFPKDLEVIITDTVGFIHNLPKDLMVAFRATLEELESAHLLIHVIDASNPEWNHQLQSVDHTIKELGLSHIPVIKALNKADLVDKEKMDIIAEKTSGIPICAKDRSSLKDLVERMTLFVQSIVSSIPLSDEKMPSEGGEWGETSG